MVKTKAGLLKRVCEQVVGTTSKLAVAPAPAVDGSDTELTSESRPPPDIFVRMPCSQDGRRCRFERELWLLIEAPAMTAVLVFLSPEGWKQALLSDIHTICSNIFNLQLLPPSDWQLRAGGQPLDASACTLGDLDIASGGALRWCRSRDPPSPQSSQDSRHALQTLSDTSPSVNLRLSPIIMAALRSQAAPDSQPAPTTPPACRTSPQPHLTPHKPSKRARTADAFCRDPLVADSDAAHRTPHPSSPRPHSTARDPYASPAPGPVAQTPLRPARKVPATPATPSDVPASTPLRSRQSFRDTPARSGHTNSVAAPVAPPATPLKAPKVQAGTAATPQSAVATRRRRRRARGL